MTPQSADRDMTPSAARRRLGDELRTVRDTAGLTLENAASLIQRSAATLSRLENGKSVPRLVDVKALLDQYVDANPDAVTNGTRDRIIALAEQGRAAEWFAEYRDVISSDMTSDDVQRYVEFESDAKRIWSYEPEIIPGLLQTSGYAKAATDLFLPERSTAQRERFVAFRLARQRVLRRLDFDVVIGEAALRRVVGPPDVMQDQLRRVLDNIRNGQPNVRIRIAPIELSIAAVYGGPFVEMEFADTEEPGLVYVEAREGSQYLRTEAALARYRRLADDVAAAVSDKERSQALVEGALKEHG